MRVTTKVFVGYTALIGMMIFGLAYQLFVINRLQTINQDLAQVDFRAALGSLRLGQRLDLVEELTLKYFLLQDPDYRDALGEAQVAFVSEMELLRPVAETEIQRDHLRQVEVAWSGFEKSLIAQEEAAVEAESAPPELLAPPELVERLNSIRATIQSLHDASVEAIQTEAERSSVLGEQSVRISWAAAVLAILSSLLVAFGIVRSIDRPLKKMTEGTRAVSSGNFSYRLDTSSGDEFAELARDFNTMSEKLGELDEMKQDLVSHVSHDLKAPVASIREAIHVILEGIAGPLNEKQRRLLTLSEQSAERLSRMIGNLLDLSRMNAGAMQYEISDEDLTGIVDTVVSEVQLAASERRITVDYDRSREAIVVECDRDRILQVLQNLLENALKFSPEGSSIHVGVDFFSGMPAGVTSRWRARLAPPKDGFGYAVVSVSDSGPGVPDAHKERIFEKFHQVKQEHKVTGQGVGLGLSICRGVVAAHGGAIWVENREGAAGSVFRLLLHGRQERQWARIADAG